MAINSDGLFAKANESVTKWNDRVAEEEDSIGKLLEYANRVEGSSTDWRVEGSTIVEYLGNKETYTDIVIPNYVDGVKITAIGKNLFREDTYARSLSISDGIQTIGDGTFRECSGFTGNLIIPNNVQTLGNGVFSGCRIYRKLDYRYENNKKWCIC